MFNQQRLLRRWSRSAAAIALQVLAIGSWFGVVVFGAGLAAEGQDGSGWWLGGCAAAAGVVAFVSRVLFRRALLRWFIHSDGTLRSKSALTVAEDGLRFRSAAGETLVAWTGIRSIEEHQGQILVYVDVNTFHAIPESAFSDPAERAAFLAGIRSRSAKEQAPGALILATPFASPDRGAGEDRSRSSLSGHLLRGLRLAFFLRPESPGMRPPDATWSSLVAMTSFCVALPLVSDLLQTGPKGSFFASALPEAVFGLPVLVVAAWALARLFGRARDTLALLVALASLSLPIAVVDLFLHLAADGRLGRFSMHGGALSSVSSHLAPLWLSLAASIAAIRLLGAGAGRRPAAILVAGLLVGLPMTAIDRHPTLWWAPPAEEEAEVARRRRTALANEDAFYLQPKLLEQQLAALKRGRRGVVDLYFIGMAAYASQDVFMKEVKSVRKLFDERFDTAGRSLMLINNPATVSESPIATPTSLGLSLKRVAEVMNRDEDILFLFITSHGSQEHGASFDFFPLRLNQLEPARLKALLDQSGIQRRVVVVSACYSGSFVDALQDDKTLVISASAADRNSFGCSNDADFTYFGKAYFDEALRKTYSFSEAFEMARPLIADRERKEHFRESGPRMFVGKSIQRSLGEFVSQREEAAKTASRLARGR